MHYSRPSLPSRVSTWTGASKSRWVGGQDRRPSSPASSRASPWTSLVTYPDVEAILPCRFPLLQALRPSALACVCVCVYIPRSVALAPSLSTPAAAARAPTTAKVAEDLSGTTHTSSSPVSRSAHAARAPHGHSISDSSSHGLTALPRQQDMPLHVDYRVEDRRRHDFHSKGCVGDLVSAAIARVVPIAAPAIRIALPPLMRNAAHCTLWCGRSAVPQGDASELSPAPAAATRPLCLLGRSVCSDLGRRALRRTQRTLPLGS